MITHLVFFKFKAEACGHTAAENRRILQTMLESLPAKIPSLRALTCGADMSRSPASFDFGLSTVFDNAEALESYRIHPAHQEVVAFIQEVTTERAVVDYVS